MYGTFCTPLDVVNAQQQGHRAAVRFGPSISRLVQKRHTIDVAEEAEVVVVDKGQRQAPKSEPKILTVDIDFVWRGGCRPLLQIRI